MWLKYVPNYLIDVSSQPQMIPENQKNSYLLIYRLHVITPAKVWVHNIFKLSSAILVHCFGDIFFAFLGAPFLVAIPPKWYIPLTLGFLKLFFHFQYNLHSLYLYFLMLCTESAKLITFHLLFDLVFHAEKVFLVCLACINTIPIDTCINAICSISHQ